MTTPPLLRLIPALAAFVALSGCADAPPASDASDAEVGDSTSNEQPSPTPTPTAHALPEAADGTDLDACADAECEVMVEEGDEFTMDGAHGVDRFVIDTVDDEGLSVSAYGPGTMLSGHLPPPDEDDPNVFVMNGIAVTLVGMDGSSALMRLAL